MSVSNRELFLQNEADLPTLASPETYDVATTVNVDQASFLSQIDQLGKGEVARRREQSLVGHQTIHFVGRRPSRVVFRFRFRDLLGHTIQEIIEQRISAIERQLSIRLHGG
jgi:hypothetical protein